MAHQKKTIITAENKTMNYKSAAIRLWKMLDDIDTYSDVAKDNDKVYRRLVEAKQQERFAIMQSDGYSLFSIDDEVVVDYHKGSDHI